MIDLHLRSSRATRLLLMTALLGSGIAAGRLFCPSTSHACSFAEPGWSVALLAIESEPGAADHSAHWPRTGQLSVSSNGEQMYSTLSLTDEEAHHRVVIGASR
jgi:hypothetical protein